MKTSIRTLSCFAYDIWLVNSSYSRIVFIPVGAKLKFKDDPKIEVTVIDSKNQVLCRCGHKHSLSRAAICCYDFYHKLPEEQSGKDRNGFAWFSYNKILLKDMKPVVNSEF